MKKLLIIMIAVLSVVGSAEDNVVAATLREDGSTNKWTRADLQNALGLVNRKYWRDMRTEGGRRKWHGGVKHSIRTNEITRIIERVETYDDGFVYVDPAKLRPLLTPEEEATRYLERKEKAAEARGDRIAGLRARIAMLEAQTNSYAQAAQPLSDNDSIALSRTTINLIKCRRLLKRMEAQSTTNIVNVVVQPGEK